MVLKLCMTTVTSSRETKSQQNEIMRILDTRGVPYELVDISAEKCLLEEMREKAGNPSAVPPQLFWDDKHLGGYELMMDAVEDGKLDEFLQVQN